jgi:hypothetical protein
MRRRTLDAVREQPPLLLRLLGAIDTVIWAVVLLGVAVAFLLIGHTAGKLVGVGLLVVWLCLFGAAIWRFAKPS